MIPLDGDPDQTENILMLEVLHHYSFLQEVANVTWRDVTIWEKIDQNCHSIYIAVSFAVRNAALKRASKHGDPSFTRGINLREDFYATFVRPVFAFYCPFFLRKKKKVVFRHRHDVYAARLMDLRNRSIALRERWCHHSKAD